MDQTPTLLNYETLSGLYIVDGKNCNFYLGIINNKMESELIKVSIPLWHVNDTYGPIPAVWDNGYPFRGLSYKKIDLYSGSESELDKSRKNNLDKKFFKRKILSIKSDSLPKIFLKKEDITLLL